MGVVVLALLAVLCIGATLRSSWAVALIILMFTLEQSLQGSVGIFRTQPALANYVIAFFVGLSAVRAVFALERPFLGYFGPAWWCSIAIFGWGAISLLWSPSGQLAGSMTREGLPYFVLCVIVAPILIDDIKDFASVATLVLVFGTIIALTMILNPEFNIRSGRLGFMLTETVRSNPLAIGELGGILMIVSVLYRGLRATRLFTVLRVAAFVVGTALALYSGSRGQVLFGGGTALAFFALARQVRSIASFAATTAMVLLLGASLLLLAQLFLDTDLASRWDSSVLAEGAEIRRLNILDLFIAFGRNPLAWLIGLGWNAFSSVTDSSKEPYSHILAVDILTELGIPLFLVYCVLLREVFRNSRALFEFVRDDPHLRSAVAAFIALAAYQFLLSNKQGHLWGVCPMFMFFLLVSRVRMRHDALAPEPEPAPQPAT